MTIRKKPFENILGKVENAGHQHFVLFPQCFLTYQRQIHSLEPYSNCHLQMYTIWTNLQFHSLINSFPNKPWFLLICRISLLKTLWEKEKLLITSNLFITSNFSFSQCFLIVWKTFYHFHLINMKLWSANSFRLEKSKICGLGKDYELRGRA